MSANPRAGLSFPTDVVYRYYILYYVIQKSKMQTTIAKRRRTYTCDVERSAILELCSLRSDFRIEQIPTGEKKRQTAIKVCEVWSKSAASASAVLLLFHAIFECSKVSETSMEIGLTYRISRPFSETAPRVKCRFYLDRICRLLRVWNPRLRNLLANVWRMPIPEPARRATPSQTMQSIRRVALTHATATSETDTGRAPTITALSAKNKFAFAAVLMRLWLFRDGKSRRSRKTSGKFIGNSHLPLHALPTFWEMIDWEIQFITL